MKKQIVFLFLSLFLLWTFSACDNGFLGARESSPVDNGIGGERAAASVRRNSVSTADFEGSLAPWKALSSDKPVYIDYSVSHGGNRSMRLPHSDNNYGMSHFAYLPCDDIAITGMKYRLEMWVRMDGNIQSDSVFLANIAMVSPDNPADTQTVGDYIIYSDGFSSGNWKKLTGEFTMPNYGYEGYSHHMPIITICGAVMDPSDSIGNIYVDDVTLTKLGGDRAYPQNVEGLYYPGCISNPQGISRETMNGDLEQLYKDWRTNYLVELDFKNGSKNFSSYIVLGEANGEISQWDEDSVAVSQSEALGYGMITMALMEGVMGDEKAVFDSMYRLYVNLPCKDNANLMSWAIPFDGDEDNVKTSNVRTDLADYARLPSATDGDMDVAYALLLANDQWGGSPSFDSTITYYDAAIKIIKALEDNNIFTGTGSHFPRMGCGDHESNQNYERYYATRSSDFMLSHMELFYDVTGDSIWKEVREATIRITQHVQGQNSSGLMPDFMGNQNGASGFVQIFEGISDEPSDKAGKNIIPDDIEGTGLYDDTYYFNGCRFPWRTALSYAHSGFPEARASLVKINTWLLGKYSSPSQVVGGYHLDGSENRFTEIPQWVAWKAPWYSSCFAAPFMSGLLVSNNSDDLADYWNHLKGIEFPDGSSGYYENTIKMLNMLLVSHNWWEPSGIENNSNSSFEPPVAQPWQDRTAYQVGDLVTWAGSTWQCTMNHTSAYWKPDSGYLNHIWKKM